MCGILCANFSNYVSILRIILRITSEFVTLIREKYAPDAHFSNFHHFFFFGFSNFHQFFWFFEFSPNFFYKKYGETIFFPY